MENSDDVAACIDLPASPERVFRALTTVEICDWWVRPGVFDTRAWRGDVRVGGRWETSGVGRLGPYRMEGEFLEIDAPRRLVHSWTVVGAPGGVSTVAYDIEAILAGARLTLRHRGLTLAPIREATAAGWETSLGRLAQLLQG